MKGKVQEWMESWRGGGRCREMVENGGSAQE